MGLGITAAQSCAQCCMLSTALHRRHLFIISSHVEYRWRRPECRVPKVWWNWLMVWRWRETIYTAESVWTILPAPEASLLSCIFKQLRRDIRHCSTSGTECRYEASERPKTACLRIVPNDSQQLSFRTQTSPSDNWERMLLT